MTKKRKAKAKTGAPTKRTATLEAEILRRVAAGESTTAILQSLPLSWTAWCAWIDADDSLNERYVRAKEARAEHFAQEIIEIADESIGMDAAGVQACKLRVDTRKWVASKILPKQYGDRIQQQMLGSTGEPVEPSGPIIHVTVSAPTPTGGKA